MSVKERLHTLIEELPESDLLALERMVRGLRPPQEPAAPPATPEERARRAYALAGKYAHLHTSVDSFLARKREDVEIEEEQYRRRHPEAA